MTRDVDLALLRAFAAVVDTGGMTAAGRRLNLTQAAVSQQIKRLEEYFSVSLFDREQRRVILTEDGERLVGHARRMLSLNDEVWGLMTSHGFEGQVRIGTPHDLIGVFMPHILREFSKAWPRVDISLTCIHTTELLHSLEAGEIDVILTTEATPTSESRLLLSDKLVWVGAAGGTAHERTPLPVTLGNPHCTFRAAAVEALGRARRDWRFICATSNYSAFHATLDADLAVAPLLAHSVPDGMDVLGEKEGLPELPLFYVNLYVAPTDPSAIALELAEHIERGFAGRYPVAA